MSENETTQDTQETVKPNGNAQAGSSENNNEQEAKAGKAKSAPKADRCCIVCNRFLTEADCQRCPTCESDNSSWFALESHERLGLFPSWAWLGAIAVVSLQQWAYLFLRGGWVPKLAWGAALLESLPISLIALVTAAVIYAAREPLRRYELKRKLKLGGFRPSLTLLAVFAVLLGTAVALTTTLFVIVIFDLFVSAESADFMRAMASTAPMFALPFITAAIMLLGANTYHRRLQTRFPTPIYCDANQMCEVVLRALGTTYLAPHRVKVEKNDPDEDEAPNLRAPTHLEVESASRNQAGGLELVVREHVTVWEADQRNSKFTGKSDAAVYDISTDEWAQITRFEPRKRKIRLTIYEPDVKTGR